MIQTRILSLCLLVILSCITKVKDIASGNSTVIPFEYTLGKFHNLFDVLKDVEIIYLETLPSSNIINIDKILTHKDNLYIHDSEESMVKVFNSSGKYIGQVGAKGKGPGEYIEANDMSLNVEHSEIYILGYRRIHVYDIETLKYIRTHEIDFEGQSFYNPLSFCNIGKDKFLFWNLSPDTWTPNEVESYSLIFYDKGVYNYYYPYKGLRDSYSIRFSNVAKGKCLIRPPKGDFNIMYWDNEAPYIKYKLQVPAPIPEAMLIEDGSGVDKELNSSEYDKNILRVFETNEMVFIELNGAGKSWYEGIYNKHKQKTIPQIGKRHPDFPNIVHSDEDYLYGYLFPFHLLDRYEQREELGNFNPFFYSKLKMNNIDASMNPILFKLSFNLNP